MLDIIIVNWNAGHQLRRCIDSIVLYGGDCVDRCIVVDNGSDDGSAADVERLSNVTLIRTGANLGFAKACNIGAKLAKAKYLLFLNPDTALHDGALAAAINWMEDSNHADTGICGVQLLDESGNVARSCARFPTPANFLARAIGLTRFAPRSGHAMAEWDHMQSTQVAHVIGAFYLLRRSVFEELQGFDERFFLYLEDLDFSYRAHLAGWRSMYLANIQAFHAGGGTSQQVKSKRLFYALRSQMIYAFKHFSLAGACGTLAAVLFIEPVSRTVLAVSHRSGSALRETWGAYWMLWRWLLDWVRHGTTR
jgi:hypothetical protein